MCRLQPKEHAALHRNADLDVGAVLFLNLPRGLTKKGGNENLSTKPKSRPRQEPYRGHLHPQEKIFGHAHRGSDGRDPISKHRLAPIHVSMPHLQGLAFDAGWSRTRRKPCSSLCGTFTLRRLEMTLTLIYIFASVIVTLIIGAAIHIGGSGK